MPGVTDLASAQVHVGTRTNQGSRIDYITEKSDLHHQLGMRRAPILRPAGSLRYRGGSHLRYVFRGRRGLFLRPPHVRDFVKEGYFFVLRYEVWWSKSPYNPRNIRGSDAE